MRLFICSDKADEALLESLTDVLDGYRMTVDIDRMIDTRDSRPALQAAIQDCDAFVFALTPNAVQNKRCIWEFGQAEQFNRPIVVAVLEAVTPYPKALEPHLTADLQTEDGREVLLDALYAVGATPPSVLVQLFRNRLLLWIVILVGFLSAWLLAGPYSPFRPAVLQTLRDVVAVADRTVDLSRPIPTQDPNDPALVPIQAMTLSANADSIFRAGQELARNGNYEAAIDAYNRTLELVPGSVGAHIARANAFHAIGATDTAWGDYTRAIDLAPNLALPYLSRAAFYVDLQQAEGALADVNSVLAIEPDNAEAHNLRGEAYFIQGQYDTALAAFNHALSLQTDYAAALSNRGEVHRYQGRAKAAREDFDRALQLNPLLGEAYTRRGTLLLGENNTPAALDDFTRAIELNPDDVDARYERATIYMRQGEYTGAAGDFSRAIARQSTDPNLYLLRGSAYRCAGQPTLAVADFTSAAELDLDATVAYLRRQAVYACIEQPQPNFVPSRVGNTDATLEAAYFYIAGQLAARAQQRETGGDTQGAANDYALAIIMTPSYTDVANLYNQRGQMYERLDLFDLALADYETASEILPERGQFHVDVGRLLAQRGEIEDAFRRFALALELNPISVPAYLAQGDLHLAQGNPDRALNAYTRASYIDKDNVDALTRRVSLLVTRGDCQDATVNMETLRATAPEELVVIEVSQAFDAACAPAPEKEDG